jgi:hypothetical protein
MRRSAAAQLGLGPGERLVGNSLVSSGEVGMPEALVRHNAHKPLLMRGPGVGAAPVIRR